MVNFRFHLVSLIAVFLALGLGILTGSAVVNEAIVDTIRAEIRDVRGEVNELRATNRQLSDEIDRSNAFIADIAPYTVDERLSEVPVTVVAERGVSGDAVEEMVALLRSAGADAPAVVWLESRWKLETDDDLQDLQSAVDVLGGADIVRTRALDQLAIRLSAPPEAAIEGDEPDLLAQLTDAGFIEIEGENVDLAVLPSGPARAVVVTGTDSTFAGSEVTVEVTRAFVEADVATVAGEVFARHDGDDARERGDAIAPVRGDEDLASVVSTVDDLDLVQGQIAATIALQDLVAGIVGHYGYGNGATASLPPLQPES
jgi:hypothetical protein